MTLFAILSNWLGKNFMVLNPDKSSFMLSDVKDELQTDLVSNNATFKNGKEKNVLGITFDSKLDLSMHLTNITKKVNIKLNALTRVQKYMTSEQKTFLTSSLIKSQFNYCPLISMFFIQRKLCRLNNLHERSLRFTYQDYVSNVITLLFNANKKSIQEKYIEFFML